MWPWIFLGGGTLGLVLVAASDSSSSSSSSSSSGGPFSTTTQPPEHSLPDAIEMTCDEALAALPEVLQPAIQTALLKGTVVSALNSLADQMDAIGDKLATLTPTDANLHAEAAFHIIGHCLRARAINVGGGLRPVTNSTAAFAA
jgi:hypothetical protein